MTAISFLAEIGDIGCFESYKKLIAYIGFDPAVHRSGNHVGHSRVSKRENKYLIRRVIWLMALMVTRYNNLIKE
ncbi:MAG: IS110 family transposase [Thermoanaerobacteraceae bacterium]|nr:IS110 family transposase [Thermoanaerobacteraceae bacterium]